MDDEEFSSSYNGLISKLELLLEELDSIDQREISSVLDVNVEEPVQLVEEVSVLVVEEVVAVEEPTFELVEEVKPVEIIEKVNIPVVEQIKESTKNTSNKSKNQESIFENEFVREIFDEKISLLEDEFDADLFEIAKMEGEEQLEQITEILNNLSDEFDSEESNKMKRLLHTLKGGARMSGANKLGGVAHRLESLLDFTESHNISISAIKSLLDREIEKIKFLMDDPVRLLNEKELHWLDSAIVIEDNEDSNELVEEYAVTQAEEHDDILENEYVKEIFTHKISLLEDEFDADLFEIAKMEGEEQLEQITEILNNLSEEFNPEESNKMKRLLHTLKGGARMSGANRLGGLAHRLESLLEFTESHNIPISAIKFLLDKEVEKIKFMMDNPVIQLSSEKAAWLDGVVSRDKKDASETVEKVQATVENKKVQKKVETKKSDQFIRVSTSVIDSLVNETNEIRLTRNNLEDSLEGYKKSISDIKAFSFKLQQILKEVEVQAESQIQSRKEQLGEDDFDPLEFDRFTRLQELTRFMAETVSDINDSVIDMDGNLKHQGLVLNQQGVVTNNVVTDLMKVRLIPVETLSEGLYAITRKTAKELGKKAILEIVGEKTELDRIVLDKIKSPIEHLLRNSLAHGIELPEERLTKGKNAIGRITLDVKLEGNYTIIKLIDDGGGINVEKVKKIGISKGLIKDGVNYSQKEIVELIFAPGFSTADTVSQVSGRGVGMDVVKSEITALNGSVSITTEKDKGSQFIITLPVSMATSQSMLVEVGENLIAIPAMFIEEVSSIKEKQLVNMYNDNYFEKNNARHPFHYLGHLLGGPLPQHVKPEIKNYNSVILLQYLGESVAVHVDRILNTYEVLIKPLGPQLSKISGIIGATILGSGRQGLITNPVLLKQHWEKHFVSKLIQDTTGGESKIIETKTANTQITVMVVDDSLTVRKASSKVLERNNFKVILAKDGEDALEQLQISIPDIILSDIEMPNMDGFELLKNLKNSEKYRNIPIIMITSRTADKHKNHAFELGANGFLGKPFQEEELIRDINKLTNCKIND